MRFSVHRTIAALLLFALPLSGWAQIRIYLPTLPFKPMTLAPGLYASDGDRVIWESEPHEIAVRIERVEGNWFSGELELVCLDRNGSFVWLESGLTGTIGSAGISSEPGKIVINPTAPLTIQLQDEPLRSVMLGVTANMQADGFRLSWEAPRRGMAEIRAETLI